MEKIVKWNLKAPEEKWMLFREKLAQQKDKAKSIMSNTDKDMNERYREIEKLIYKAAIESIGRTTIKRRFKPKPSNEMKQLRKERREMKKDFENETDKNLRAKNVMCISKNKMKLKNWPTWRNKQELIQDSRK